MPDTIIAFDKSLLLYLNGLGSPVWDGFWATITNEKTSIPLYILVLVLFYKIYGVRRTFWALLTLVLLIAFTDQLANLFKNVLAKRLRPCHDTEISAYVRLVNNHCGGMYGYFSAHAANAFAFAAFFGRLFWKRLRWLALLLFVWAAFTAYSRIYLGVHYPLDVVTGICFGSLAGVLASRLLKSK